MFITPCPPTSLQREPWQRMKHPPSLSPPVRLVRILLQVVRGFFFSLRFHHTNCFPLLSRTIPWWKNPPTNMWPWAVGGRQGGSEAERGGRKGDVGTQRPFPFFTRTTGMLETDLMWSLTAYKGERERDRKRVWVLQRGTGCQVIFCFSNENHRNITII